MALQRRFDSRLKSGEGESDEERKEYNPLYSDKPKRRNSVGSRAALTLALGSQEDNARMRTGELTNWEL